MNRWLLLILLPLGSMAQSGAKWFDLKASLKLIKPIDKVYLRYRTDDNVIIDSMQTSGQFHFEGKISEPTKAVLMVMYKKQPQQQEPERNVLELFLEPGKINVTAKDSLQNNTVTGSASHTEFIRLMKEVKQFDERRNILYSRYDSADQKKDKVALKGIQKEIDALDDEIREKTYKPFAISNPNSPIALFAVIQYAGYNIDADKVAPVLASLPASVQKWPSALMLKDQIEIAKKTGIGKFAPDFSQNDTSGHPVSLSSFKGKYVLVDFWASWCGPCRGENPNLVKAYNKFRDKNFTILSVSLDRTGQKDRWLKAIHDDGLTWNHVSDLKFWDNAVAKQYDIREIPQNLLIDPTGKIIAKNLRGEDLEQKLAGITF